MTTVDCTEIVVRRSLALTRAAGVADKVSALLRALRNRREFYHLGQMSDIELADIGLRRGDLYVAGENPLFIDPTGRLGEIAEGRITEGFVRLND